MDNFQEELLNLVEEMFDVSEDDHQEILRLYKKSRDNINQFISKLFMDYGNDGQIEYSELQKHNRMQKLEKFLKEEAATIAKEEITIMTGILVSTYGMSYYKTAYKMEQNLEIGINFNLLKDEFVDEAVKFNWSGIPFSERIWDNTDSLVKGLRTELTTGIREGESIDKVARRINKQFNSKAYQSKRLVQTEAARIIGAAQDKLYTDSEIVKQVEWVATLESNTCSECARLDGQRFNLENDSKPSIPRHPLCKCCFIAIPYADYQPSKRKDNETKEVIEYSNFEEWAKTKDIKL
ncbi:minor capsid protein [Radiobacillus sp. PE A8.2]|uniref:minor capsid protein n=1 Tax=Radiobacillus sp. PE A8.2 TaxID=3380349 RepID=UPI00388EFED7